jgi:hypothetical protein
MIPNMWFVTHRYDIPKAKLCYSYIALKNILILMLIDVLTDNLIVN